MKKGRFKTDQTNPKVKSMSADPFKTSWPNSRPMAKSMAAHPGPGGERMGYQPENMEKGK